MEFRCKSCGTQLNFAEGQLSAKCGSCGNTYMIFDFLDKDSDEYQEQAREIKEEKERYDALYHEYADDVLEADSYCLTSADFSKIISFFERAEENENTVTLLKMAKFHFIKRVASYSECQVALQYLDEIDDIVSSSKSDLAVSLTKLATSFKYNELVSCGLAISIPKGKSSPNLLSLCQAMIRAVGIATQVDDELESRIIGESKQNAVEYIDENGESIISTATSLSDLKNLQKILPDVSQNYSLATYQVLCDCVASKIVFLSEAETHKAEEKIKENAIKEKQRRKNKLSAIIIASILLFSLIGYGVYLINGYSASNVSLKIVSKTNDKYNENLASGYSSAGYFYTFEFDVENNSPYDIKLIRGNMEIFNANGESLSTSSVEMQGKLLKGSSGKWNIQLNVDKGNDAREIWDSDLEDLKITFTIKAIYFNNGTNKTYSKTKKTVIHEIGA